ncbi:MAG: hypothetical protein IAF08_09430 [Rhizobacter sp.]|nr:hypothetical protein [Chlorobiales bacterium]
MKFLAAFVAILLLTTNLFAQSQPDATKPVAVRPDSTAAKADTTGRPDYFYFQTSGTPKFLLSESARSAVLAAAQASGYTEAEIEVTVYVVDKNSKGKKEKQPAATRKKLSKPKVKKFE